MLKPAIAIAFGTLVLSACGGGGGGPAPATIPTPGPSPTVTPTQAPPSSASSQISFTNAAMTAALPSVGGYSGSISIPSSNASGTVTAGVTSSTSIPNGVITPLSRKRFSGITTQSNAMANPTLYISIKLSASVTFSSTPGFTITVPSSFPLSNYVAFMAAYDPVNNAWTEPVGAPATITGQTLTFQPSAPQTTMNGNVSYVYALYPQVSAKIRSTISLEDNADMVVLGPDGNFWSDERSGPFGTTHITNIDRLTPSGTLTRFPFSQPSTCDISRMDGGSTAVWFIMDCANGGTGAWSVGSIASDGTITTYPVSNIDAPGNMALGSDGNIYFSATLPTTPNTVYLVQVTPSGGITKLPLTGNAIWLPDAAFQGFTAGGNGELYYADSAGVGAVSTSAVVAQPTPIGDPPQPSPPNSYRLTPYLVQGADGNLYTGVQSLPVTNSGSYTAFISSVSPTAGTATYYQVSPTSQGGGLNGLTRASDGSIWFLVDNNLGHFAQAGVTEYNLPTLISSFPLGLIATSDGSLWVYSQTPDSSGNKTSQMTQIDSANP